MNWPGTHFLNVSPAKHVRWRQKMTCQLGVQWMPCQPRGKWVIGNRLGGWLGNAGGQDGAKFTKCHLTAVSMVIVIIAVTSNGHKWRKETTSTCQRIREISILTNNNGGNNNLKQHNSPIIITIIIWHFYEQQIAL